LNLKGTAYLLQAALIMLWWIGLSIDQDFYRAFQFPGISSDAFNSFFAPDILVITLLSIIRAYKNIRALEFVILGGFSFGTLYCINASILTQGGYLATALMILGLCYNLFLVFQETAFRESQSSSFVHNGLKTFLQIICVWFITLAFIPWLILQAFEQSPSPQTEVYLTVGVLFLVSFSILGLSSAYTMVKNGNGTPLPIDQTNQLVLTGPYRYVRNPMAIAGLGQGIAVSIIFASIPILVYTMLGAFFWQFVVRPIEEKNLQKRFGKAYEEYKQKTGCWLPNFKNYTS